MDYISSKKCKFPVLSCEVAIVGSGAAGMCAADELGSLGKDVIVITDHLHGGTSRCAGSDKQTYYKLTTSGNGKDSVKSMAQAIFDGGSTHGDIALTLASNSLYSFYKLVLSGVPFPSNEYGEFVGYKTDHDDSVRATSCGPLTSKYMAEKLEESARKHKNVKFVSDAFVFEICKDGQNVNGVAAVSKKYVCEDNPYGVFFVKSSDLIWATGGPSSIYSKTVYPTSQGCSFSPAILSGCRMVNLTESQYGIASTKFRWNLSGSYQQAIPRYISVEKNGKEHEFLYDYMSEDEVLINTFLKGYQWPFSSDRISGSSKVDLAVDAEILKGRKVYLDYTTNPKTYRFSTLPKEAKQYIVNSGANKKTPFERLNSINPKAVKLYKDHGIDLSKDYLEIAVCAQHLNGGFDIDCDGKSTNTNHMYFAGECAGTYGVKRPGGSALLAGQVFAHRACESISKSENTVTDFKKSSKKIADRISGIKKGKQTKTEFKSVIESFSEKMSDCGAELRSPNRIKALLKDLSDALLEFDKCSPDSFGAFKEYLKMRDILVTQYAFLSAYIDYFEDDGKSRGAYVISDMSPSDILKNASSVELDKNHRSFVHKIEFDNGDFVSSFVPVKPIPESEQWFEKVYNRT